MTSFQRKTKKYAKISVEKRRKLIQMVETKKIQLTRASKKLNINFATAKAIMSKFRTDGLIFNKNMRKKRQSKTEKALIIENEKIQQNQQIGLHKNQEITHIQKPVMQNEQEIYYFNTYQWQSNPFYIMWL